MIAAPTGRRHIIRSRADYGSDNVVAAMSTSLRPLPGTLAAWLGALCLVAGCSPENGPPMGGDTGGNHLVVVSSDRNQSPGQLDLYLYDLDVQGFRLIANLNSANPERNPTLSADGLVIAFESTRGITGSDLYLYSRADQAIVGLPSGVNTPSNETEPAFTGDAVKLAFTREVNGFKRICLVDGIGDTLLPLPGLDTTATYSDWAPAPNLSGNLIAFVSDRNGTPDVFVWDRALRGVRNIPVLVSDSLDLEPAITSDGHYLSFASNRLGGAGGFDLYLYNLASSLMVPLTVNAATHERNPSFGAGGDVICFQSDRAGGLGKWDIWVYSRVSGSIVQGTQLSSTADDVAPSLKWP